MYKEDLALDNLQWLICHKTKLTRVYFVLVVLLLFYFPVTAN